MTMLKPRLRLALTLIPTLAGLCALALSQPAGVASRAGEATAHQAVLTATNWYTQYLPLAIVDPPAVLATPSPTATPDINLGDLQNGDFEADTWRETLTGAIYAEIAVPESWVAFWKETDGYGRPEMSVIPLAPPYVDPLRVYEGAQGLKWFTFYRSGDAGVLQQVAAEVGQRYRAEGFAHVWYSQRDDPYLSQWVDSKTGIVYTIPDGDPGMEAMIGLDPLGGTDPWAVSVVWGKDHIYDQFDSIAVETTAISETITVFIRTRTLYPFKHCDAYWDSITLEAVD